MSSELFRIAADVLDLRFPASGAKVCGIWSSNDDVRTPYRRGRGHGGQSKPCCGTIHWQEALPDAG